MNTVALLFVLLASVCLSNARTRSGVLNLQGSFNLQNTTNFVVYWGSTDNEGALTDHCNDNIYDVIILAFAAVLDEEGVPRLYIDQCDGQDCSRLVSQVQTCQQNGKTVMLSVGGGAGSYILKSEDYAKKVATHLWNMFLKGTGETRPFGDSVVLDGVDFDIEAGTKDSNPYWVTLINELRSYTKTDPSKRYYFSGAPQCVLPDAWFGPGAGTAISEADLDFISIQFYNNYCGVQSFFQPGQNFNFAQWSSAVTQVNPKMKLLLGIPAGPAAGQGYEPADHIKTIYDTIKNATNFAGIMMWDAGNAKRNNNFGRQIRDGCLS